MAKQCGNCNEPHFAVYVLDLPPEVPIPQPTVIMRCIACGIVFTVEEFSELNEVSNG